jgi:hypothetical protein
MCDALQGIRDQAHVLCFLQQSHCFRFVRSGRHLENYRLVKFGELRNLLDPVENGIDIATYRDPLEFRCPRDRPERQDEAIGDRRRQQRFRRPPVARPAELGRPGRLERIEPGARQLDIAVASG